MKQSMPDIYIETERLLLKNLQESDISQNYIDWLNDPEINKYLGCASKIQTRESCISYVRSYGNSNDTALVGIFRKNSDLHIGNVTLSFIDWHNQSVSVGISIGRKEYQGYGLGEEALNGIIQHCVRKLEMYRITAGVNVNNFQSLQLFLKCGFKVEALLRSANNIENKLEDSYLLSLLKSELIL